MSIKVLRHRRTANRYIALVLLDDTKTNPDGSPDQNWVRRYTWPLFPRNPDLSDEEHEARLREYEEMQIRWLKRRVQEDLYEAQPEGAGAPLPHEGESL